MSSKLSLPSRSRSSSRKTKPGLDAVRIIPKLWKDRLHRGMKRRAGQRLEINIKAAPSVLLAPFPNWITLHSPAPSAVFTGTTCSLKPTPYEPTRLVSCVTGLATICVQTAYSM